MLRLVKQVAYILSLTAVMAFFAMSGPSVSHAASLKELQDQLTQAEQQLSKYQSMQQSEQQKASNYAGQIEQTQNQINQVKNTIQSLTTNIADKEKNINDTSGQIDAKTTELNNHVQKKNDALASFYELTNLSQVEILADSHSLSHVDERGEYIQALQDDIVNDIQQIASAKQDLESTKAKLEQQKNELAALKGEQVNKSAQLASAQKKNINLFSTAKANAAEYQDLVKKVEADKHKLSNDIYVLRQQMSAKSQEKYIGGTSGYPYSAIHAVDPWGFLTRECTSYAAWKWNVVYGRPFTNTRPGQGSAWNWPALAKDQGYSVISTPRATAIISWGAGSATSQYGHVGIVEKVNSDGTIDVSEYNYVKYSYSYRQGVRYQDYGTARFIVP